MLWSDPEAPEAKVMWLRQKLEQIPHQKPPEIKWADDQDWLKATQLAKTIPKATRAKG